jgi:hypothetical protein
MIHPPFGIENTPKRRASQRSRLVFSSLGSLVSSSGDTTLRLWDTEPLRLRSQMRRLDKGTEASPTPPPERVFVVLERIGTAEARQILINVAKRESQSAWAKAARIVLKRLED